MNALKALLVLAILLLTADKVFGLAGDLKTPGVALSSDLSTNAQTQIRAALERPDCKFLGGNFINWTTTLRYEGDTRALNLFLEGLAKCPETSLSISFVKTLPDEGDWQVQHNAHGNHFHIRIRLESKRIDLEQLALPTIYSPAKAPEAKAP